MSVQLYRIAIKDGYRRGQMLCDKVGDTFKVCGFINDVDLESGEMEVCLFDPTEEYIPDIIEVIKETMTKDEMEGLLYQAIVQHPDIYAAWVEMSSRSRLQ